MALVNCPECGRENVSDSAESCPSCGYSIKMYYEAKKNAELKEAIRKRRLESVQMPEKPTRRIGFILFIIVMFFLFTFFISSGLGFLGVLCLICALGFCIPMEMIYKEELEKYELAVSNFERYKQKEIAEKERLEQIEREKELYKPKCPTCGSSTISKISTTSRAVSIATVGIASSKIDKQFECKKCGFKW